MYDIVQEENKMEWIKEKINVLKNKFGTDIKLRSIKYYKIYKTLEEQQIRCSLVPIPSATPQPIAIRLFRTQIPTPVIP